MEGLCSVEAKKQYIDLVQTLAPSWRDTPTLAAEGGGDKGKGKGGGGGPVVSTLMNDAEEAVPDDSKNAFDWCKEGHMSNLKSVVTDNNINSLDDQVCHWPCPTGRAGVIVWYTLSTGEQKILQ